MSAGSVVWNVVAYAGGRLLVLVSTAVLARLLEPEAFGLVALAMLAVNLFDRFKDLGVGASLIQSRGRWSDIAPTGATLTALSAAVLAVAAFFSAPLLAALLGDDDLVDLIRVLSLSVFLSGLGLLPDAALRRRLRFSVRALPELANAATKAAVSIALALAGHGVWSLVWGQVAGSFVGALGSWLAYLREPRPDHTYGWDPQTARSLLRFGGSMSWLALAALVLDNLDYISIGRRQGAEALGYYTLAFRLPELLVVGVCIAIGQVLFSSFSRLQHDLAELRAAYLSATRVVAAVTVPLGLGLSAGAAAFVPLLFGPGYGPSVPILTLLGLYSATYALSFHSGEVYKALGRTVILNRLSWVKLALFAPVLWVAAGRSAHAVAGAFLGLHVLFTLVRLAIIRRVLDIPVADQWRAIAPSLVSGAALYAAVVLADEVVDDWLPLPRSVVLVLAGALAYGLVLHVLDRGLFAEARTVLLRRRSVVS